MLKKVFVLLMTTLCCSPLFADEDSSPDYYDYNVEAFNTTRAICQHVKNDAGRPDVRYLDMTPYFVRGILDGAQFWKPDAVLVTSDVKRLVNSKGFNSALFACFGHDLASQRSFKLKFTGTNYAGHIVGFSLLLVPVSFTVEYLRATEWAVSHPSFVTGALRFVSWAGWLSLAGVSSYLGYDYYKQYERDAHPETTKKDYGEAANNLVDMTKEDSEVTHDMVQELLDRTNAELAKKPLDPKREQQLLASKAILEDRLNARRAVRRYAQKPVED